MKILLIEDNRLLVKLYSHALATKHYTVDVATDGEMGLELALLSNYDLIILDIELPKLDGLSICQNLRSQKIATPILMLTSHSSNEEIIKGLDAGADDYLVKPCNHDQLLARIRALLRRGSSSTSTSILTWGNLQLNPSSAQVTYKAQTVLLRPKEYTLLELCLRYPQRIFTRDAIIDHLWTIDDCPTKHAVTNLIKDLRLRLKKAGMEEELIETVYGIGYRVNASPIVNSGDNLGDTQNQPEEERDVTPISQIDEQLAVSLERSLEIFREVAESLKRGELTEEQRISAQKEAHQLAESLETFGYFKTLDTPQP